MKRALEVGREFGKVGIVAGMGLTALYNIGASTDQITAYLDEIARLADEGSLYPEDMMLVTREDLYPNG